MSKRGRVGLAVAVALTVCVGVVGVRLLGSGPDPDRDPRAYPVDEGDVSLSEALRRAGLTLPDCLGDKIRYAFHHDDFSYYRDLYVAAETSVPCGDALLGANRVTERIGPPNVAAPLTGPGPKLADQLGWRLGPDRSFQRFGLVTDTSYLVEFLVSRQGTDQATVYVYAHDAG